MSTVRSIPDEPFAYFFTDRGAVGAARFSDDVRVKISAEDPHSRIEKITYSAPVKSRAKDLNRSIHKTEVPNSGEDKYKQSVEFTIAPEYEGQVRAAATNYAGLETSTEALFMLMLYECGE